ncbi:MULTISPECIES: amphi-Trp domain-containing protein [Saliphagus]|uniref:Amphi-Trp domain-containing protein n=1 Tax=Saliphagus infecundisoli TaxID=1849069 RepID=A0ABD5QL71_9EURY|nr:MULTISPECIES: amphi-Trp domain-containing protein [Saliphagus]
MSDKTRDKREIAREDAADRLQELARDLRAEGGITPRVGNKTVDLSPPASITYDVTVEERSPMIGADHETVTVVLDWAVEGE